MFESIEWRFLGLEHDSFVARRKAQKAEADLRKASSDLRAREREKDAAELRAGAAQAEVEKGSSASQALTAAKRVSSVLLSQQLSSVTSQDNQHYVSQRNFAFLSVI